MFSSTLDKTLGRWGDAERSLRTGMALDPLNTYVLYNLGDVLYLSGRFAEAETILNRLLATTPKFQWTRPLLALTLLEERRVQEALLILDPVDRDLAFANPWPAVLLANGRKAEADETLQRLAARQANTNAWSVALNYAYRNEKDLALQWLERAARRRRPSSSSL